MGLIGKMITGAIGAKLLKRLQNAQRPVYADRRVATTGQYIPANQVDNVRGQLDSVRGQVTGQGNRIVERAGRFYKENPKLVHTIGSAALAIALARLSQRRRV